MTKQEKKKKLERILDDLLWLYEQPETEGQERSMISGIREPLFTICCQVFEAGTRAMKG